MRLYLGQGRREAAIRQYRLCSEALQKNFDILPDHQTRKLFESLSSESPVSVDFDERVVLDRASRPTLVLVVEDELVTRTLIEGILIGAGYEVVLAEDGAEALLELGKRKFDLVLLDINIPTLDGLKLFEIMIQKGIETPSIFVTALTDDQIRLRGYEMGATAFLRKPIVSETLLNHVQSALVENASSDNLRGHA